LTTVFNNQRLQFLHIPKTGGVWVVTALRAAGIAKKRRGHEHATFDRAEIEDLTLDGSLPMRMAVIWARVLRKYHLLGKPRRSFCFVRHPLRWYESYWRYQMDQGNLPWGYENTACYWHPASALNGTMSQDFNEFVSNVISKAPGFFTSLYFAYAKPWVEYVGKTESLVDDLLFVLNAEKISCDQTAIQNCRKANAARTRKPEWNKMLMEQLILLELPSFLHFGYFSEEECRQRELAGTFSLHNGLISKAELTSES